MLPGPTFVKTFLRTYAEALGLDPHLLVEEYRANYEPGDDVDHIQSLGPPNLARDRRRRAPRLGPGSLLLLVVVAVVGALVAIGLLAGDDDDPWGDVASETAPRQETTERRQQQPERRRPTRVVLRITPLTPTYVCVDRGGGTPVLFETTIDAPQTFRGRTLRVNLGKTDVEIRKNGRPVPIASGPDPVGFEFTARGRRALPLGERPCA
jgi:cytoskeleton protein RodZ